MKRLRYAAAVAVTLVWTGAAFAEPPVVVLPKEVTGAPGAYISVQAVTKGKNVSWNAIDPGLNLFPTDLLKDSKTAVVTALRPGRYRLEAVTAAGDEISPFATTTIVIEGVVPDPIPDPKPAPGPVVFPDGKYKLSKFAYDNAMAKVPAQAKRGAANLADSFTRIGQQATTIGDVKTILTKTTESNREALVAAGVSRDDWVPFFAALQEETFKLYGTDKTLVTAADYATAWAEIAAGLKAVK